MKFQEIESFVGQVPFISRKNAKFLYELILREKTTRILELGIAHGTATCYMAAALQELGEGFITSVDLLEAQNLFMPTAEDQLEKTELSKSAEVVRMQTGYNWFLHNEILRNTVQDHCNPIYDLCIIDGPKNWTIDGAAFFFADKLLKPKGWIIFDDYNWTYDWADSMRKSTDGISHRSLSKEEKEVPHIREVFELLVKQHPDYSNFIRLEDGDWALAQKTASNHKNYKIIYQHEDTYKSVLARVLHKAQKVLGGV